MDAKRVQTLLERHPVTGLHYACVIPGRAAAYTEIRHAYERLSKGLGWLSVHDEEAFREFSASQAYQDDGILFVLWGIMPAGPKHERKAKVALVFSEAVGSWESLLPAHREDWKRFLAILPECDGVFAHTPWMVDRMGELGAPARLLPVGWDEEAHGRPDWEAGKTHLAAYYGSPVGKRQWSVPAFREVLGDLFIDRTGTFGKLLNESLQSAKIVLYLAHSDVQSFSTWRTWQALATSAAFVGEPGDFWPLVPEEHYLVLPRLAPGNVREVALDVARIGARGDLLELARRAHEELARRFTVGRMIHDHLVPGGLAFSGRGGP